MANRIKCTKKDLGGIVAACFPEYRGRKFAAQVATTYSMANYWDGGSRSYVVAYDLATGKVITGAAKTESPFNSEAHAKFEIPAGVVMVEHAFAMGQDIGITVYARPENFARVLPGVAMAAEISGAVR